MPNLGEHCKHSKERYGYEGREIHQWLDEPSRVYGGSHRGFRHDEETVILAGNRFGKNYGEGVLGNSIAQQIALDHIILDQQEALKNRLQGNDSSADAKAFEEVEAQYEEVFERKKVELKKVIDEYSKLPKLLPRDMSDYLEANFTETPDLKNMADFALRHWYQFILKENITNRKINKSDVYRFISEFRKKVNATTRSNYYCQLIPYFKHAYGASLSKELEKEKENADRAKNELRKGVLPPRIKDVKLFYQKAKLPDKIATRLLVLEDLQLDSVVQITFIQAKDGLHFQTVIDDVKQEISIDSETARLAIPLIQKSKNGTLFGWKRADHRNLDDRFKRYSERLKLTVNITPQILKTFGKNQHPDDLKEILADVANFVS